MFSLPLAGGLRLAAGAAKKMCILKPCQPPGFLMSGMNPLAAPLAQGAAKTLILITFFSLTPLFSLNYFFFARFPP